MYKIRLWATALLVALCTGFYSCSGDDEDKDVNSLWGDFKVCLEYGITDYEDIKLLYSNQFDGHLINTSPFIDKTYANFCGVKNNRLWMASFDIKTKKKLMEWMDTKEFEIVQRIDLGYGEYEEIVVSYINILNTLIYNDSFVTQLSIGKHGNSSFNEEHFCFFKTPTSFKEVKDEGNIFTSLKHWHQDSYFANNICYSFDGSIRYVSKHSPNGLPISYEEGIEESTTSITRYNYKEGEIIWNTSITPPFDSPSDARSTITLLDNSTNIWKYKVDYTFYDGTKKEHTFSINIDNGEIQ